MKNNVYIRKIDAIGRLYIPKEIIKKMPLMKNDPVEFYIDGDLIILKKYIR